MRSAHLGRAGGDTAGLAALRSAFAAANPGYDVEWHPRLERLVSGDAARALFVQSGAARASLGAASSELGVGDVVLVRAGEELVLDAPLAALSFRVPSAPPESLPAFVRPDYDPRITDTPGGCAEESGAYRRILLTWLDTVGPYVWHALNAHRVRISDSFTHYHPRAGGFDELYLVQGVQSGARVLTSERVDTIERGDASAAEAGALFQTHTLAVGDLVLLPRGTAHRGLGGVLAQVITVPGFRPGAEVGLDHLLRALGERLGVELPYHAAAATSALVK